MARITLNRPDRHNALSMRLSEELTTALELVRDATTVKVLVIQGAGGTFCAGDDITEMGQWGDANEIVRRVRGYQRMADTLADLDFVTGGERWRERRSLARDFWTEAASER